jgi:hypothetical protein
MKALMAFLKRIQLSKLVVACLLGAVVITMTACNNGNEMGARPEVPPVQMGGQNNPYKMGGDGYGEYKSTLDPAAKPTGNQSMAPVSDDSTDLMASTGIYLSDNGGVLLYPAKGEVKSADSRDDFVSPQRQKELLDPGQIPAVKQPVIDRSDPDANILEKVGQTFKDASDFITEPAEESQKRGIARE